MFEFTDRTILCIVLNDLNMREKNEKLKKYLSLKTQMEKLSTFLILAQFQNFLLNQHLVELKNLSHNSLI